MCQPHWHDGGSSADAVRVTVLPTRMNQPDSLRAQIFQRLHPHAYLDRFLVEGVRPDARTPDEWRDVFINVGTPRLCNERSKADEYLAGSISTADGSALVKMGGTTIVCGVKAEIAEPELDTPNEGFLSMVLVPRRSFY